MRLLVASLIAGLSLIPALPARAGKVNDTLQVVLRDAVPDIDPYHNTQAAGAIIAIHVWDTLAIYDPVRKRPVPGVATEWRQIDDLTIEFKLRPGVTFHNGDALRADDVVYTVQSALTDKRVATPSLYGWMAGAEKVDDATVRIKAKAPFPAALSYLTTTLPIMPKAYRERVGADEFSHKPVGTGPYRVTGVSNTGDIRLERFDGYFPDSPKGRPAIKTVMIRAVLEPVAQLAELIGGKADWIQDVNPDQLDSLGRMPRLKTMRSDTVRIAYLNIAGGREPAGSPLTNPKVRQALFYAVDREEMARQFMPGGSHVPDIACVEEQFGCDASEAVHYSFDPKRAKELLAEAGYPDGFSTELYTYMTPSWGGAIQNYLRQVGIKASLQQLAVAAVIKAAQEGKEPLALAGWSGFGTNDVSTFLGYFFTGGTFDQARDLDVRALVEAGGKTLDQDRRREDYRQAFHLITERAEFMPLFTFVKTYAMSRDLAFTPSRDDLARFYLARWD